jgi:hypothetical protein
VKTAHVTTRPTCFTSGALELLAAGFEDLNARLEKSTRIGVKSVQIGFFRRQAVLLFAIYWGRFNLPLTGLGGE